MRNRWIKNAVLIFFVWSLGFSFLAGPVLGTQNAFPFFNWNLFETQARREVTRHFALIHRIGEEEFVPPRDALELKKYFWRVNFFAFSDSLNNGLNEENMAQIVALTNRQFLLTQPDVQWELVRLTFNPVEYYKNRDVTEKQSLGVYATKDSAP